MKQLLIAFVLGGALTYASAEPGPMAAGKAYYREGELHKAVAQFQVALKQNPADAEAYYWTALSYERLADIAMPFGGRARGKALQNFVRATQLAPDCAKYRQALFEFLLDSSDASSSAVQRAELLLRCVPESDPEYTAMHRRLAEEQRASGLVQRTLYRAITVPLSMAVR